MGTKQEETQLFCTLMQYKPYNIKLIKEPKHNTFVQMDTSKYKYVV